MIDPKALNAHENERCPNISNQCRLVSDGKGAFACQRCGVGFFLSHDPCELRSFDWHGSYPWTV